MTHLSYVPSKSGYLFFYFLIFSIIVLLFFFIRSIWKKNKRSLTISGIVFVLVSWYFVGFTWRLLLLGNLYSLGSSLSGNAYSYTKMEFQTDISSLLSDKILKKFSNNPVLPGIISQIGLKYEENNNSYYIWKVYWFGFDGDDDKLENYRSPGSLRILYFPWFFNGDVYMNEGSISKELLVTGNSYEKQLLLVKSAIILFHLITEDELPFINELKKQPNIERKINKVHSIVTDAFKRTYAKEWSKERIDSVFNELKGDLDPPVPPTK